MGLNFKIWKSIGTKGKLKHFIFNWFGGVGGKGMEMRKRRTAFEENKQ